VILLTGGFNRARSKILTGIQVPEIKEKFLNRLDLLTYSYSKQEKLSLSQNSTDLENNINKIIDERMGNFNFEKNYSDFQIKNSPLQKIYSLLVNKKFIVCSCAMFILFFLIKIIKGFKYNPQRSIKLAVLLSKLKNSKIFISINSFISGIFKLLVNY
jgi:hypothetical protein